MSRKLLSLKDGCLNTIVENIEVFAHAYEVADSPYLKRLFRGLQRLYSMEILSSVCRKSKMKDEYLSFLLNESLSSINLVYFTECSSQEIINRICEVGDSVTEFIVPEATWCFQLKGILKEKDNIESVLKSLRNLQVLHLDMDTVSHTTSTLSDQLLKTIVKNCPLLKFLNVSYSRITDTGLKYICGFDNEKSDLQCLSLQILDVTSTNVTNSGLAFVLQSMHTLNELICDSLPDALMTVYENYSVIKEKKHLNLTNLVFEPSNLKNSAYSTEKYIFVCNQLCPNIEFLHMRHLSKLSEPLLCTKLENLNSVELDLMPGTVKLNVDPFLISQGSRLRNLTLTSFEISLSAIVNHCFRLHQLRLYDVKVVDTDMISAHSFSCLNTLVLGFSKSENVNKKIVTSILKLATNLSVLQLDRCTIDEECGIEIMKHTCLTTIKLFETDYTFNSLLYLLPTILEYCSSLKSITIYSFYLSYEDCIYLQSICSSNGKDVNIFSTNDEGDDYPPSSRDVNFCSESESD